MKFIKNLRKGDSGSEVKFMQACLIELEYDLGPKGADGDFGTKTKNAVKLYQQSHKDLNGFQLKDDGIIGEKTWDAIIRDYSNKEEVPFKRTLKSGMSGDDVLYIKQILHELHYYDSSIKTISSKNFGNDTVKAVKAYQAINLDINGKYLKIDGVIGQKTWDAIVRDHKEKKMNSYYEDSFKSTSEKQSLLDNYTHITLNKRKLIEKDLEKVSDIRKKICLEILNYAYDADSNLNEPLALYLFGANLYDSKLKLNYADAQEVEKLSERNPQYFSSGRKEWMLEQIKKNPRLPASDCSGMEVGYLRKHKFVKSTFDTTANGLCGNSYSKEINKKDLQPGDWVGKTGHIGTYVGGGYVVEFYGGAYGCQLTSLDNRKGYDFLDKKIRSGAAWTKFRRPRYY